MDEVTLKEYSDRHMRDFGLFAGLMAFRHALKEGCVLDSERAEQVKHLVEIWKRNQKALLTKEIAAPRATIGEGDKSIDLEIVQTEHVEAIENVAKLVTDMLMCDE